MPRNIKLKTLKIERRLSEGIAGWLFFEEHCNKTGLFSERYLSFPIGQILSSVYGSNVHSEYIHPIISSFSKGRGAKPKVDFAVLDENKKPTLAIETKWIGQSVPSIQSVLWDIIRLESLAREYNTSCIFILGGRKKHLEEFFKNDDFTLKNAITPNPILSTKFLGLKSLSIISTDPTVVELWRPLMLKWRDMKMPSKIGTQLFKPFPEVCKSDQFQIYSWRIFSYSNKTIFIPRNTKYY